MNALAPDAVNAPAADVAFSVASDVPDPIDSSPVVYVLLF